MPDDQHDNGHDGGCDGGHDEERGTAHDAGHAGLRRSAAPGVFLAHAPADADRAAALDGRLRADGVRTALDEYRDLGDGLPAEPVLQELGACDLFLLLWSREAADDSHVQEQRRYAASFDKPFLVRPLDTTALPPGEGQVEQLPPGSDDQETVAAVHRLLGLPADPQSGDGSGRGPATVGAVVGSGHWTIESDAQHGDSLEVGLSPSADAASPHDSVDGGLLTGTHRRAGLQGRVVGRWWFSRAEGRLDLELESSFGLSPVRELRHLQLLGSDDDSLTAEDLHGIADPRHYRLTLERPGR